MRSNGPSELRLRPLAGGEGWNVCDVICNAGPHVRPSEEQHQVVSIAIVRSGTFQYRSGAGRELMTPGSLLLGNPGQYFECSHEHGVGDRCLSFSYQPWLLEELVSEAGLRVPRTPFSVLRVPVVRELSSVVARACARSAKSLLPLDGEGTRSWEEIALELPVRALELANGTPNRGTSPSAEARVTRVIRMIDDRPAEKHSLGDLATAAKLSRFHFLRVFQQFTSLTPHQYLRRIRLRRAATRLLLEPTAILDIALDSGFGDVSNFNHAFISEFAVSPRLFRRRSRPRPIGDIVSRARRTAGVR